MALINVAEADDLVINWLVATCEGIPVKIMTAARQHPPESLAACNCTPEQTALLMARPTYLISVESHPKRLNYTTDWNQAGEIIDRENIFFEPSMYMDPGAILAFIGEPDPALRLPHNYSFGNTRLIAAMRCRIVNKLGSHQAQVPDELIDSSNPHSSQEKQMSNLAYLVTYEDVENVLRSNSLVIANALGKSSYASMAEELFDDLDFHLIEKAALYGDDLDQQTTYANEEIARQLRENGTLEPLKTDPYADLKALGYRVSPSPTGRLAGPGASVPSGAFQWQLNMVRNGQRFPTITRPEQFASEALAWADAQKFHAESTARNNPDIVTLRLTLDVTYDLKGESITVPRVLLRDIVKNAIANGQFTGNTNVEVEDHTAEVTQITGMPGESMGDDAGDAPIERSRG